MKYSRSVCGADLVQPAFIIDYPVELNWQRKPGNPELVERFGFYCRRLQMPSLN
jgi:lysyl-tRNA synthetase class II